MKRLLKSRPMRQRLGLALIALAVLIGLLFYHLGSLPKGLSSEEVSAAQTAYGWHGIIAHPLNLPLELLRSLVFQLSPSHGQFLTRLPNACFGVLAIIAFGWLLRWWHGTRTALFTTALFACAAWTLHVSRLASNDVLYLWGVPTLLLLHVILQRPDKPKPWVQYGSLALWGLLLYIPGMVWFVLLELWQLRSSIAGSWKHFHLWWQRTLYVLTGLIWLPLLVIDLTRSEEWRHWLGLSNHWPNIMHYLREVGVVIGHLFVRGPNSPTLWLGRAPLLDVFTLVVSALGLYFYVRHWRSGRSRLLASYLAIGILLVAIGGAVSLSVLVPILYLAAGTGMAYLLHEWLQVFPFNPLARALGLGLVIAAIALSCIYNIRAYFVAWGYNPDTVQQFRFHR
ncbi:MAG TPA: hypothetical protein VG992_01360 [Candidatus Saccharimonadales bacterium]|nr:hypothetical protein [Candidatus Saccharimonadales bacterium]